MTERLLYFRRPSRVFQRAPMSPFRCDGRTIAAGGASIHVAPITCSAAVMSGKLVVYVSSTYQDLAEHRSALKLALEKAGYDVVGMETYAACDERPLQKCLADVAAADVYVLLVAHRYGYRPKQDNPEQKSITRLEYEQALATERPALVFTVDRDHPWSPKWIDRGEDADAVAAFRSAVEERHVVDRFTDPDQLAKLVLAALAKLGAKRARPSLAFFETKHNLPAIPLDPQEWPGQNEPLERLMGWLAEPGTAVVLRGMDGVGKRSLATRAAHGLRQAGGWQAICGLEARNGADTMADQLITFAAARLDLVAPEALEPRRRLIWCLEHWPGASAPVLLLLHDLSDPCAHLDLARGLPDRFQLLITTRLRLDGATRELELRPLEPAEAVRLLERRGRRKPLRGAERDEALTIARQVGGLPLALALVARALRRDEDLTLTSLRRRLEGKGALASVLLGPAPELQVEQGLEAGFDLIWEGLPELPREMALCLATLAKGMVPWDLLATAAPEAIDPEGWEEARGELRHQSLLERPQAGCSRLHPLLHDLIAAKGRRQSDAVQQERQRRIATAVAAWSRQLPVVMDPREREQWQGYLPQLELAAGWPPEVFTAADACWPALALGRFHSASGLYRQAVRWLDRALQRVDPGTPSGAADRASCLEVLGGIQRERGELDEAEASCREALALRETAGEKGAELAGALDALGQVLHERGDAQAEALLRRALALRQRHLPAEHEFVVASLNNLGKDLVRRGERGEALQLFEQGLLAAGARASQVTLALRNNLAWLHHLAGRPAEAMEHQRLAAFDAEAALGEDHPDRGQALMNLAVLEDQAGLDGEAESHYRQALAILEGAWGADDLRSQACSDVETLEEEGRAYGHHDQAGNQPTIVAVAAPAS